MDDEKIKELAQATGLSEEETKQKVDKTETALDKGADFMFTAIEMELTTKLTDKQKEKLSMAYKMSLMFMMMGMK